MLDSKFDVFISHSSHDKPVALSLYFNILANGKYPWFDAKELVESQELFLSLNEGISNSNGYLLIASPASKKSKFVKHELGRLKERLNQEPDFKIWILCIGTKSSIPRWLRKRRYVILDNQYPEESLMKIVEEITGMSWPLESTKALFFNNASNLISKNTNSAWDLVIRSKLGQLYEIKNLLSSPAFSNVELIDTLKKLVHVSAFRNLPVWQSVWRQIDLGLYEILLPVRMRIPPKFELLNLPAEYGWNILEHSEIHVVIEVYEKVSGTRVSHVVPFFPMAFDAEM